MNAGRLEEALQYIKSGDYGVALSTCRDVIERHPDDADALHLAGYLHQLKGEHDDALRYFAQAGLLAPRQRGDPQQPRRIIEGAAGAWSRPSATTAVPSSSTPASVLAHHNFADLLI